jgi:hypothetical protein
VSGNPAVLVQMYWDRSGIQNIWGPFPDVEAAKAAEPVLRDIGLEGLMEPALLRSLDLTPRDEP